MATQRKAQDSTTKTATKAAAKRASKATTKKAAATTAAAKTKAAKAKSTRVKASSKAAAHKAASTKSTATKAGATKAAAAKPAPAKSDDATDDADAPLASKADRDARRNAGERDVAFSRSRRGAGPRPVRDASEPAPNYNDRNVELFTQRRKITQRMDVLEDQMDENGNGTFAVTREHARLRRRLDDITTEIVQFNYGLVRSYVKKFTSNTSKEDSADFEAAAVVGLMRAIDSFDIDKGRFGSWAYKPIVREVLRAVRDADHPNMNPGDFERRPDILRALAELQGGDDDYTPSFTEVAAAAGVTVEQVGRVLDAPHLDSLATPMGDDGDTSLGDMIEDRGLDVEATVLSSMAIGALEDFGLSALEPRELLVIARRFGLDCEPEQKLAGIGQMLGLSREAVRQVEAKALAKIQHPVVLRKIQRHGRS